MKRKNRVRYDWIPKEDGYICGKCGAKGDCGDDRTDANENKLAFYWDEKNDKVVCMKCGHWLETKKELEDKIKFDEIQHYGFWLRFASEHFHPCSECQDALHEMLMESSLRIEQQCSISLTKNAVWEFNIGIIRDDYNPLFTKVFIPCKTCQKKLQKIWEDKELHIGNENKPMVELWRKWELIEEED